MKCLFTIIILFITFLGYQQTALSVQYESQADVKVLVTKYASETDVKIYFIKYESEAGWNNKKLIY